MRAFIILFLVSLTGTAVAQTLEERLATQTKAAEESRDQALKTWRLNNDWPVAPGSEKYGQYAELVKAEYGKYRDAYTAAYNAACTSTPADCNPQLLTKFNSQVNIAVAVVEARHRWAREGKTEQQIADLSRDMETCANNNQNCSNVPERERRIANESNRGRGGGTQVTVTPEVTPETTPEKKDEDFNAARTKMQQELEAHLATLESANPGWQNKELTPDVLKLHQDLETWKMEKLLSMMAGLCEKYPDESRFCSEEAKNLIKDLAASNSCQLARRSQSKEKSEAIIASHEAEWAALDPKECKTLLDKDKGTPVTVTPDEPEVTPGVDVAEDQSPRNYDASTCTWASDMPRRIVNGPSCGKTRARICTGYVICKQKDSDAKFVRMSTCRPEFCGAGDKMAQDCTKDRRYFSTKPASEDKEFASKRVRQLLQSGASEQ